MRRWADVALSIRCGSGAGQREEADLAAQAAAAALTPEAFQAATAAGRALAPDQALRVALG
jgi:hypothetical protein